MFCRTKASPESSFTVGATDEVAKYIVVSPESIRITADLINRYPDRFLFGTDEAYLRVYNQYAPLWKALSPEVSAKVRRLITNDYSTKAAGKSVPGKQPIRKHKVHSDCSSATGLRCFISPNFKTT